jgi:hypothetical protein
MAQPITDDQRRGAILGCSFVAVAMNLNDPEMRASLTFRVLDPCLGGCARSQTTEPGPPAATCIEGHHSPIHKHQRGDRLGGLRWQRHTKGPSTSDERVSVEGVALAQLSLHFAVESKLDAFASCHSLKPRSFSLPIFGTYFPFWPRRSPPFRPIFICEAINTQHAVSQVTSRGGGHAGHLRRSRRGSPLHDRLDGK